MGNDILQIRDGYKGFPDTLEKVWSDFRVTMTNETKNDLIAIINSMDLFDQISEHMDIGVSDIQEHVVSYFRNENMELSEKVPQEVRLIFEDLKQRLGRRGVTENFVGMCEEIIAEDNILSKITQESTYVVMSKQLGKKYAELIILFFDDIKDEKFKAFLRESLARATLLDNYVDLKEDHDLGFKKIKGTWKLKVRFILAIGMQFHKVYSLYPNKVRAYKKLREYMVKGLK